MLGKDGSSRLSSYFNDLNNFLFYYFCNFSHCWPLIPQPQCIFFVITWSWTSRTQKFIDRSCSFRCVPAFPSRWQQNRLFLYFQPKLLWKKHPNGEAIFTGGVTEFCRFFFDSRAFRNGAMLLGLNFSWTRGELRAVNMELICDLICEFLRPWEPA